MARGLSTAAAEVCCSLDPGAAATSPPAPPTAAVRRTGFMAQVLTDRFAGHRPSIVGPHPGDNACGDLSNYCGGTWMGIRDKLKYIQVSGGLAIRRAAAGGGPLSPRCGRWRLVGTPLCATAASPLPRGV